MDHNASGSHSGHIPILAAVVGLLIMSIPASPRSVNPPILEFIRNAWVTLTRVPKEIAKAAPDPKFPQPAGGRWPVYVAASEDRSGIEAQLRSEMLPEAFRTIEILSLPPRANCPIT